MKDLEIENQKHIVEPQKYRLSNPPEEYELVTKYLGWLPENEASWNKLFSPFILPEKIKGMKIVIVNPEKTEKIIIILDHQIIKDAFPMSFYGEKRVKNWHHFCIVSTKEDPDIKFIIPLH